MDWKRRRQIQNLVDGILECNSFNQPPIEIIGDIMKSRGILFEERDENDDEFYGVYIIYNNHKFIFVNSNIYSRKKNFTIAHELGHHYLGHTLKNGAITCDKSAMDSKNKERPEEEKEADYFAACLLMPPNLLKQKKAEFEKRYTQQISMFTTTQELVKKEELIKYLCNYFQVSKESMEIRLEELKII